MLTPAEMDRYVQAHLDRRATDEQIETLRHRERQWVDALWRRLDATEQALARARRELTGAEKLNVVADLDEECYRIDEVLTELVGAPDESELQLPPSTERSREPEARGVTQLQLSRADGRLVAWASGRNAPSEDEEQIRQRIRDHGGGAIEWDDRGSIKIPGAGRATTLTTPLASALGWLIALADSHDDDTLGASATWMGLATATAVELVAQGRVVPQIVQSRTRRKDPAMEGLSTYRLRWAAALVGADALEGLVRSLPAAVMVGNRDQDQEKFTLAVLGDLTDAIVSTAAGQLEVPAAPPDIRTRNDVGEAVLCHLDGSPFVAPSKLGSEVVRRLSQWSQPVVGAVPNRLIVQLDEPDDSNAWHVAVLAPTEDGGLEPVEVAVSTGSKTRTKFMSSQLTRLERLMPELLRGGGRRVGEVVLSQDEAWRLMSESGDVLAAAGFDVRVPSLSRRKATPSLRLTSEADEAVVGAQQLANVRWSAVFDEVELTAADIARLAAEARPLVQSHGRWVEIDKADLAAAAAALADRADQTQLTGADMLRHALGLEGSPLAGGISIDGEGWAADLLRSVQSLPEHPESRPEGFVGELRTYQADALAWLNFLDEAGLGGCLALDMGLGKTPTSLANLALAANGETALVIAPPAVVGNWASEAKTFVPDLKVLVHHGAGRAKGASLSAAVRKADVVITTYGTAVRDMDQLCELDWSKVVIDEAQTIKNPLAETSQQLRRLQTPRRLALTGTPIENGLGDLWAIMDWANPGLLGPRASFISQLTPDTKRKASKSDGEDALRALNGILVYRRTKAEPLIAEELPDRIDELDHCPMTPEQIGLYQAVIDGLVVDTTQSEQGSPQRKGAVLAAITALKQICNHPVNYQPDDEPLDGRSGKLARLNEIVEVVFAADEKMLVFTHFATWGQKLATYLSERTGKKIECYHGGLTRGPRDRLVDTFQNSEGAGAMVLSLKAGGTGLNLTAANHVVLYDRWWNPAVEDQARDRVWRIGQEHTVICHRLVCPGTIDERVEEVVSGKRQIADITLPKSSSIGDLDPDQLQRALGIDPATLLDMEEAGLDEPAEVPA